MKNSIAKLSLVFAVTACTLTLPAAAQLGAGVDAKKDANAKVEPPSPNLKPEEPAQWPQYILGGVLILVALGANLIPTKRGHQD